MKNSIEQYAHYADTVQQINRYAALPGDFIQRVDVYKRQVITPDVLISEGDSIPLGGLSIRALHTPGHTAGSYCYLVGDALFSGDTLFQQSCGRTDFPTGDSAAMARSLRRLADLCLLYTSGRTLPHYTVICAAYRFFPAASKHCWRVCRRTFPLNGC